MLLPVGAAFGPLPRSVEFRTIAQRGDPRANARSADVHRHHGRRAADQSAACRNSARRRGGDENPARRDPRASATALNRHDRDDRQNSCAGHDRARRARRISCRRRIFARDDRRARGRVGALLATILARGKGPLVAEFLFAETRCGPGIVAVAARRTVVAIEVRAVATRRIRALVAATVFARFERTLFTVATARWTGGKRPVAAGAIIIPVKTGPRRIAEIPARRTVAVALAGVGLAATRIGLFVERSRAVGFPG